MMQTYSDNEDLFEKLANYSPNSSIQNDSFQVECNQIIDTVFNEKKFIYPKTIETKSDSMYLHEIYKIISKNSDKKTKEIDFDSLDQVKDTNYIQHSTLEYQ